MDGEARSLSLASDRMFILAETFDIYVRDHPAVVADLDLTERAATAAGAMYELVELLHARLPESEAPAAPVDRMLLLKETFDLYVRDEHPVTSSFRLSLRAFFLSRGMRAFTRRLAAKHQTHPKDTAA